MADRPILFSGPMIKALIAGRKTQTRRLIGFPGIEKVVDFVKVATDNAGRPVYEMKDAAGQIVSRPAGKGLIDYHFSPRIGVGDRLWVRETWSHSGDHVFSISEARRALTGWAFYQADENKDFPHAKYWPSIHMPKEFSRLTLIVTDVRIERLQDISEDDAMAEGVPEAMEGNVGDEIYCPTCRGDGVHGAFGANYGVTEVDCTDCTTAKLRYRNLWDHINGAGSWDANPFVAAYTFRVIKQNIDRIDREAA